MKTTTAICRIVVLTGLLMLYSMGYASVRERSVPIIYTSGVVAEAGLATVTVVSAVNCSVYVDTFSFGDFSCEFTAFPDSFGPANFIIYAKDTEGNETTSESINLGSRGHDGVPLHPNGFHGLPSIIGGVGGNGGHGLDGDFSNPFGGNGGHGGNGGIASIRGHGGNGGNGGNGANGNEENPAGGHGGNGGNAGDSSQGIEGSNGGDGGNGGKGLDGNEENPIGSNGGNGGNGGKGGLEMMMD
jgi:hypothetical protein